MVQIIVHFWDLSNPNNDSHRWSHDHVTSWNSVTEEQGADIVRTIFIHQPSDRVENKNIDMIITGPAYSFDAVGR